MRKCYSITEMSFQCSVPFHLLLKLFTEQLYLCIESLISSITSFHEIVSYVNRLSIHYFPNIILDLIELGFIWCLLRFRESQFPILASADDDVMDFKRCHNIQSGDIHSYLLDWSVSYCFVCFLTKSQHILHFINAWGFAIRILIPHAHTHTKNVCVSIAMISAFRQIE